MNADRAMCLASSCPRSRDCLRATAVPHPTRQKRFMPTATGDACRDFIANARRLPLPAPGEDFGPGANARWFDEPGESS